MDCVSPLSVSQLLYVSFPTRSLMVSYSLCLPSLLQNTQRSCNPPDALSKINFSAHYARGSFFAHCPTRPGPLREPSAALAPPLISVRRWRGSFFAHCPTKPSPLREPSAASAPPLISVRRWTSRPPPLQLKKPLMHMKPASSVTPSRITCAL